MIYPYSSVLKRNKALIHATNLDDLGNVRVSGRNQTQKSILCDSTSVKIHMETGNVARACLGEGRDGRGGLMGVGLLSGW